MADKAHNGVTAAQLREAAGYLSLDTTLIEEKRPKDLRRILEQHEIMFVGVPLSEESKEDMLCIIELDLYKRAEAMKHKPKGGN